MKFLRRSLAAIGLITLLVLTVWTVFAFTVHDRYVVPILMYHSISSDSSGGLNSVQLASFERQMAFLHDNGYQVISLDDLIDGMHKARMFKRNVVVITFDDGYEDNYVNAFPVLRKYGYPATVFMVADLPGTPGFMSWDQLKLIDEEDFSVASHTRRHAYLPEIQDPIRLQEEIAGSKKILEDHLGHPVDFMSYPSGGFSDQILSIVKKAGYRGACTTNRGRDRFNLDVFQLNRIRVNNDDSHLVLWAKLSGYYNFFRKTKNPH